MRYLYASELYPKPVDPTPTLAFSTNNLSPTSTGNSLAKLYATFNVAATVSVDES